MTYTDACATARERARVWQRSVTICRHPMTSDHVVATVGQLSAPKDWNTNPQGFPNVTHIVAIAQPDGSLREGE